MTSMDQDRWTRVKDRLRAEVGDDVYSSWFARMELDGSEGGYRQAVGADALPQELDPVALRRAGASLLAGRATEVLRIELTVRSAVIRTLPPKLKPAETPTYPRETREGKVNGSELRHSCRRRSRPCTRRSAARRSIRA